MTSIRCWMRGPACIAALLAGTAGCGTQRSSEPGARAEARDAAVDELGLALPLYVDVRFSGGLNFYEYAGNDPVNLIDPSGLFGPGITLSEICDIGGQLRGLGQAQPGTGRLMVAQPWCEGLCQHGSASAPATTGSQPGHVGPSRRLLNTASRIAAAATARLAGEEQVLGFTPAIAFDSLREVARSLGKASSGQQR